jgi:polysaccharide pyruvyl transferase WcaK-like protein
MAKKRILLIGGYGVGNYGDESILAGLLNKLPSEANKTALSHDPEETSRLHGVHSINPVEALKDLGKFDSIVISSGLFSGHMGSWGKFVPLFGITSKAAGIDIEFEGVGIYPSTPKFLLPMIKALAMVASKISVRDKVSRTTLTNMGINNVLLVKDLSFYMDPAPRERAIEILEKEGIDISKNIVGISITRMNPALSDSVTSIVHNVIRKTGNKSEILFLPMCRHKKSAFENDHLYSEEVIQRFPEIKILNGSYHPSEILSIFGILESCVCMRFHSMVFAYRMGVKMLPIPYAEKCLDFLDSVGVAPVTIEETLKSAGGDH